MTFLSSHGMACRWGVLLAALGAWTSCALAAGDEAAVSGSENTNVTVITSRSLTYDAEQRKAVFEGDVVVSDAGLNIKADQLTVFFVEDNSVNAIAASGNVSIRQDETTGTAGEAVYHVQEGKIVLSVHPKVRRTNDELTGETITFYRGTGRMICEPNAMLKLQAIPQVREGEASGK